MLAYVHDVDVKCCILIEEPRWVALRRAMKRVALPIGQLVVMPTIRRFKKNIELWE